MRKINRHLTLATAFVALAACSGSDAAPPPLDTEAPTTTVEATATSAPDTTTTTTTTTTATTEPADTTTTSSAPTATVPDSDAELIAEIEADLNEGEQQLFESSADPSNPESARALEGFYGGEALANLITFLADLRENGWTVRPNPEVPSVIQVKDLVEAEGSAAIVTLCRIDAAVVVIAATDDSPEILVNDEVIRYSTETTLDRPDGRWRVIDGATNSQETGEFQC